MDKALITSATGKLELLNIVLHEARLFRNKKIDPLAYPADLRQQFKTVIHSEELSFETPNKSDDKINLFRVYVELGARAISERAAKRSTKNKSSPKIYFTVEATFRVDYLMKDKLTKNEAEEFSNFNAVHNVWPFWREHMLHSLRAAELPHLNVPLMRGMAIDKKQLEHRPA